MARASRAATNRILIVSAYPASQAGPRLRAHQFVPALEAAGIQVATWSLFDDAASERWLSSRVPQRLRALASGLATLRHLPRAARGSSCVLLLRDALPFGPPVIEWLLVRRRTLIWDVDDSVWLPHPSLSGRGVPHWLRSTGNKHRWICRRADQVWAGSEQLAIWARSINDDVRVVPPVLATPPRKPLTERSRTVGWIGSQSTARFLRTILPALAEVEPVPTLVVVGGRVKVPPNIAERMPVLQLPWSADAEAQALATIRVGVYPIDESHPLAAGKAGLKAILYMSNGVPSVVTPTATVGGIVRHGIDGCHATTGDEWTAAVQRLLADDELWEQMSEVSYARAEEEYSLERWTPVLVEFVRDVLSREPGARR